MRTWFRGRMWTRLSVGLLVLALLAACSKPSDNGGGASGGGSTGGGDAGGGQTSPAPSPVVFNWGLSAEPETVNPLGSVSLQANTVFRGLLYDTLVNWTADMGVGPWLATKWEASPDGSTYTFTLKDGVKWHDGQPLTSEDVKFTIEYIRDNQIPLRLSYVRDIVEVRAVNPTTVEMTLAAPSAVFLPNLADVQILPKHYWSKIDPAEAAKHPYEQPIGSGPFKLVEWEKGNYMLFEANADYWQGRPKVDNVVARFYPSVETMLLALKQGEIDMIGSEIPVNAVKDLEGTPGVKVAVLPNFYFREISINSSDFGKQNPSLRDKRVRQALAHAVNKELLAEVIHQGYATPGSTIVHTANGHWHNDKIEKFPFDLARANQLLEEAGYTERDSDGVRRNAEGTRLEYELLVINRFPEEIRAAEMIRDWWKEIGVAITITAADGATISSLNYPDYEHDMFLWGYSGRPDPNFILRIMLTSQIQGAADAGYSNPEYDALFDQQARELDPARRKAIIDEMQRIIYEDSPYIVLYYTPAVGAYRTDRFTGIAEVPGGLVSNVGAHLTFLNVAPVR